MEIRIDAFELKDFFSTIKTIFKGVEDSRVIFFYLNEGVLNLSVQSGVAYQKSIPVASRESTSIACTYQDLSDLLGNSGTATLTIMPNSVSIETDYFNVSLLQAHAGFIAYKPIEGTFKVVSRAGILDSVKRIGNTKGLAKIFGKESAILFTGSRAIIKYPTVWVSIAENSFNSMLTIKEAEILAQFLPEELRCTDRILEFRKGNSCLSLIRTPIQDIGDFQLASNAIGTIDTAALLGITDKILSCAGSADGILHLYENGESISVSTPTLSIMMKAGECTTELLHVQLPLEYIRMFCRIAGGSNITVRKEGNRLCLSTSNITMLVSVIA